MNEATLFMSDGSAILTDDAGRQAFERARDGTTSESKWFKVRRINPEYPDAYGSVVWVNVNHIAWAQTALTTLP
jgi:hypothetical protein